VRSINESLGNIFERSFLFIEIRQQTISLAPDSDAAAAGPLFSNRVDFFHQSTTSYMLPPAA
jgi:hypothetical protein